MEAAAAGCQRRSRGEQREREPSHQTSAAQGHAGPVSADDIHDPLRHHNHFLDRTAGQGAHHRFQLRAPPLRSIPGRVPATGGSPRRLPFTCTAIVNHIVNGNPAATCGHGYRRARVLYPAAPPSFRQMRRHSADHLHQRLRGLADGQSMPSPDLSRPRQRIASARNLGYPPPVARAGPRCSGRAVQRLLATRRSARPRAEAGRLPHLQYLCAPPPRRDAARNTLACRPLRDGRRSRPDDVAVRRLSNNEQPGRLGAIVRDDVVGSTTLLRDFDIFSTGPSTSAGGRRDRRARPLLPLDRTSRASTSRRSRCDRSRARRCPGEHRT